jgi:hypothetical protein
LVVGDPLLVGEAEHFFSATADALRYAAVRAPTSYARLHKDVRTIVLRREHAESPYHRFQLAVLVPVKVAFEPDTARYATWLLYASGLSHGQREANEYTSEILRGMDVEKRNELTEWLEASLRLRP